MIYARIENGVVQEIILPLLKDDESEWPIEDRFTPEFVAELINITDVDPAPASNWTYDGKSFAAPVPYQPSPEEIKASNAAQRDSLIAQATIAIAPLQDAVDLDMATDADTAALKAWKTYRVLVNRIDLTLASPQWPQAPQS